MSKVAASLRMSEPHPHRHLHAAHLVDGLRQAELRALHDRIPAREHWMVQQIARIDARIEIEVLVGAERPLHRSIEAEGVRSGNGVSTCVATRATGGSSERGCVQMCVFLVVFVWCFSQIGAQ